MRIKAKVNLGSQDYESPLKEGEESDVEESLGLAMVARGHAVEIVSAPAPVERRETIPVAEEAPPAAKPAEVAPTVSEPEKIKDKFQKMRGK